MEELIKSSDPVLALAGAIFIMGVCFDLIFSRQFKAKVRASIADAAARKEPFYKLLSTYSEYFATEILPYRKPIGFIARILLLSVVTFISVTLFEIKHYYVGILDEFEMSPAKVNGYFADELFRLSSPIVLLMILHVFFDVISAYISILFLRIIARGRNTFDIMFLLGSDFVVTMVLWNLFFGFALALHLKEADYSKRNTDIAIQLSRNAPISWPKQFDLRRNKTLEDSASIMIEFLVPENDVFRPPSVYNLAPVVTNILDNRELVTKLIQISGRDYRITATDITAVAPDFIAFSTTSEHVIGFDLIPWIASIMFANANPLSLILGRPNYDYMTTAQLYSEVLSNFTEQLGWSDTDDMFVVCAKDVEVLKFREIIEFDFSKCPQYLITDRATGTYLALLSGKSFDPNYFISYRAFFWSSMSMTLCFYIVFGFLLVGRLVKDFVAAQVANNVFAFDKAFFTPFFAIVSVLLVFVFCVKIII